MLTKDGCGSCKTFKPTAKEIAEEYGYEFNAEKITALSEEELEGLAGGTVPMVPVSDTHIKKTYCC